MKPTTAPVVDARFCAPQATAFIVTRTPGRWSRRELTGTDGAGGAAVMLAEASRSSSLLCHSLLFDAASRCPVLTVKRRHLLFVTGRRWDVLRGHSTNPTTDLLFAAVAMPSLFALGDVHVYLGAGADPSERRRRPDLVVVRHGSYGRESIVSRAGGGAAVAKVYRKPGLFQPLEYVVSVNAGVDHAFILALTVILEEIRQEDISRHH